MSPLFASQLVVGLGLASLRVSGEKGELFQAVAHLVVGGWVGAAIAMRGSRVAYWKPYAWLAFGLSLVELLAFLSNLPEKK